MFVVAADGSLPAAHGAGRSVTSLHTSKWPPRTAFARRCVSMGLPILCIANTQGFVLAENVHALEGLACRKRVAPASSPAAPASRVRHSRCLRSTLAAAPGVLAHALVTKQ
jgi:hypothetical protein